MKVTDVRCVRPGSGCYKLEKTLLKLTQYLQCNRVYLTIMNEKR